MVRFINKNLKAHLQEDSQKILEVIDPKSLDQLSKLLIMHLRYYNGITSSAHLLQKLTIECNITRPTDISFVTLRRRSLKELFLIIEIILESFQKTWWENGQHFKDFVDDVNNFFMTRKIGLQIRYVSKKKEFYIEKVISPEISEKVKETLENFSREDKIFDDFKKAMVNFSSGNFNDSAKFCCKALEDYFCILLDKQTCSNVESFYKQVSKNLKIPNDINERFENIIKFIHKYRSYPLHGSKKEKKVDDPELLNEIIIQFTMIILNYIKKKKK